MRALSSVGIGLAIVSSLLFSALVAELYYIFWWKKRFRNHNHNINNNSSNPNSTTKSSFFFFFLTKGKGPLPSLLPSKKPTGIDIDTQQCRSQSPSALNGSCGHASQLITPDEPLHISTSKDGLLRASFEFNGEDAIDAELMRLHSLSGPPRFLFTIKEETREDLESDDGRTGSRSRGRSSLADLLHCAADTPPFLTPLASPPLLLGITAQTSFHSFKKLGFNPLFESSSSLSPPPKFKFLKDAEDKLHRRTIALLDASRPSGNGDRETGQVTVTLPFLPSALSSIKTEE